MAGELRPGNLIFAANGEPVQVVVVNREKPKAALEVKMVLFTFGNMISHPL